MQANTSVAQLTLKRWLPFSTKPAFVSNFLDLLTGESTHFWAQSDCVIYTWYLGIYYLLNLRGWQVFSFEEASWGWGIGAERGTGSPFKHTAKVLWKALLTKAILASKYLGTSQLWAFSSHVGAGIISGIRATSYYSDYCAKIIEIVRMLLMLVQSGYWDWEGG